MGKSIERDLQLYFYQIDHLNNSEHNQFKIGNLIELAIKESRCISDIYWSRDSYSYVVWGVAHAT
ncbi:MAG: hypothetical protein HOD92_22970 [Deltaproteobacteria bacterium]|jgi:hypothetical protein|nr:hypothetical protein [Deltaproteobacteria bacterium]